MAGPTVKHATVPGPSIPLVWAIVSSAVSAVVAALAVALIWWMVHRRQVRRRKSLEATTSPSSSFSSTLKGSIHRVDPPPRENVKRNPQPLDTRNPETRKSLAIHSRTPAAEATGMSRADMIGFMPRQTSLLPPPPPPLPSFPNRYPQRIATLPDTFDARDQSPSHNQNSRPRLAAPATTPLPVNPRPTHSRSRIQSVRSTLYVNNGVGTQQLAPPVPRGTGPPQREASPSPYVAAFVSGG